MAGNPLKLTKRSKVLGVPIGRKKPDWDKIRKIGMAGAGAATTSAVMAKGGTGTFRQAAKGVRTATGAVRRVRDTVAQGKEQVESLTSIRDRVSEAMEGRKTGIGKMFAAAKVLKDEVGGGDDGGEQNVKKLRLIIEHHIDVGVPRRVAYNQWTQFEEFPMIMGGVENVDQEEDDTTNWRGKVGFTRRDWKAKIIEQIPDERIVWETKGGAQHRGTVNFHALDDNLTRVHVEMEYLPKGVIEKTGNVFLAARRRVRKDLRLFKHFIELRNEETGAWRGEISPDSEEQQADEEGQEETVAEDQEDEAAAEEEPAEEPSTNGETPPSKGLRRRVGAAKASRSVSGEDG